MDQLSTPEKCNKHYSPESDKKSSYLHTPGKRSLDFILQFSRVCHIEKDLPSNMSSLVLN